MTLRGRPSANGDRDRRVVSVRIHRGARAIGSDGELGSVQQIVVDPDTGELRGIVVQRSRDGAEFELPVERIARATNDEVHLRLASADLDRRPDIAQPYNPEHYFAVGSGDTAPRVQATRTAQTTEHPVVASVEEDAAELIAPPEAIGATNSEAPSAGASMWSGQTSVPGDRGTTDTQPLHQPNRADIGEETTAPAPPPSESATPSVTGDLLGGKPTTSGTGTASTPTSTTVPPQDTAGTERTAADFAAPAQGVPNSAPASLGPPDDLTDLSDDELSNPDTALVNPTPGTEERVSRPFAGSAVTEDTLPGAGGTLPQDQSGMADAFRTATNASADDTHVVRGPALRPAASDAGPTTSTGDELAMPEMPEMPSRPFDGEETLTQRSVLSAPPEATSEPEPSASFMDAVPARAPLAVGIAALALGSGMAARVLRRAQRKQSRVDRAKRALANTSQSAAELSAKAQRVMRTSARRSVRRVRSFRRGLLLGAGVALLFAPMSGRALRRRIEERLRHNQPSAA